MEEREKLFRRDIKARVSQINEVQFELKTMTDNPYLLTQREITRLIKMQEELQQIADTLDETINPKPTEEA